MKNFKTTKPQARKEGLVIHELPEETLVYDLERDRAHCLNPTAAFVWRLCDGRSTPGKIAQALTKEINQPVEEKLVWLAINQLGRNHLLENTPVPPPAYAGLNRREVMRALGITAAVAIPVVASIVAPIPAQAATGCASTGQSCVGIACCPGCVCSAGTCTGTC